MDLRLSFATSGGLMASDYGFSPESGHLARVRRLLDRRPNTDVVTGRRLVTLRDFLGHLDSSGTVTRPISDMLVGLMQTIKGSCFYPCIPAHHECPVCLTRNDIRQLSKSLSRRLIWPAYSTIRKGRRNPATQRRIITGTIEKCRNRGEV